MSMRFSDDEIKRVLKEAQENIENSPWSFLIADKLAERHRNLSKIFTNRKIIWIGIGGSSSGPRALFRLFGISGLFLESPEDELKSLDRRSILYVVSKSGTTYETLLIFKKTLKLLTKVGVECSKSIVTVSQEAPSPLVELAKKLGVINIPFPPSLSGRFSTFFISFFPLAGLAPTVLRDIRKGLDEVRRDLLSPDSLHFRLVRFLLENSDRQDLFFCFYSRALFELSENFCQLVAESLGKDGKGFTPVAAMGPHFQHSTAQLVLANPSGKFAVFFIPKEKRYKDVIKEAEATYSVFSERIPVMRVDVEMKPREISRLMFSLQIAVAVCGKMMGINPFDQPEVKRIRDLLEGTGRK